MIDHDGFEELAAAYVLGGLHLRERADFERHLARCDRCREDVVAFAPLPALLARVSPDEFFEEVGVDAGAGGGTAAEPQDPGLRRSSRRWRAAVLIAAACLAVVGAAVLIGIDDDGSTGRPDGVDLAVEVVGGSAAEVEAIAYPWGTYLDVSAQDLPRRDRYQLFVVDRTGRRHPAGAWSPTPDGFVGLGGATELGLSEIDRVVITSGDPDDVILVARSPA